MQKRMQYIFTTKPQRTQRSYNNSVAQMFRFRVNKWSHLSDEITNLFEGAGLLKRLVDG